MTEAIATPPQVSVVVTSRNRKADVLRAVGSCYAQVDVDLEVLVFDDASDDGTVEAVRAAFPQCRVFTDQTRRGYIVNRNRGFAEARGDIVFSLDDDAYFSAVDSVKTVLQSFADPTVGAVAVPYIEPLARRSQSSLRTPFQAKAGQELRSYVGCSHALRRASALALGGYRELFIHQREEADLCLRMWAAGQRVVYAAGAPVVHMVQRKANDPRVLYFGGRNLILHEWLNAPLPDLILRLAAGVVNYLRYEPKLGHHGLRVKAVFDGLVVGLCAFRLRQAVPRSLYRRVRALPGHGPEAFEGEVPASPGGSGL